MSATTDNVVRLIEAQTPGASEKLRTAVLFQVVADFCRNVVQTQPPVDVSAPIESWMPSDVWSDNQLLMITGTLARLYVMTNKPWSNPTAAQAQAALFITELDRARERYATRQTANNGYNRIMQNIRTLVVGMRDPSITQELFNTVDELRRNILQTTAPDHASQPETWMTSQQYSDYFRLIMAGTLFRIYAQSNKPWSDPKAAALQQSIWNEEVSVVRGDAADDSAANPTDRIMANLRSQLPGIKDAAIYVELFNVIDEACRDWYVWVEIVQYKLDVGMQSISIVPPGTSIVKISSLYHPILNGVFQYDQDGGIINMTDAVTYEASQSTLTVTMALAPDITVAADDPKTWIPRDLWGRLHQLLLYGCLSRLKLQSAKAWSDPKLGVVFAQRHRRLLTQARLNTAADGLVPSRQNWAFPRFA